MFGLAASLRMFPNVRWTKFQQLSKISTLCKGPQNFLTGHLKELQVSHFHTTASQRGGLSNLVNYIAARIGAAVAGRGGRWYMFERRGPQRAIQIVKVTLGLYAVLLPTWYISYRTLNKRKNQTTGRKQFIDQTQMNVNYFTGVDEEQIHAQYQMLKEASPEWMKVATIVKRIQTANLKTDLDLSNLDLHVDIIHTDVEENAYVLPNGHVYVTDKLVKNVASDAELAFIIACEIAHSYLNHGLEVGSEMLFMKKALIFATFYMFLLPSNKVPVFLAALTEVPRALYFKTFPKQLELEGDEVALKLMARACYDIRKVPEVLKARALKEKDKKSYSLYHSTHPYADERAASIMSYLDKMMAISKENHCDIIAKGEWKQIAKNFLKKKGQQEDE